MRGRLAYTVSTVIDGDTRIALLDYCNISGESVSSVLRTALEEFLALHGPQPATSRLQTMTEKLQAQYTLLAQAIDTWRACHNKELLQEIAQVAAALGYQLPDDVRSAAGS